MAHENKVLRSINMAGEALCVDLFQRPDGSHGFETYRRDPEDGRGWYPVGHTAAKRYATPDAALAAARAEVPWLADAM